MIRKQSGGISWLEFTLLQEAKLKHGVFLRHGGVSQSSFASLNLGASVGDQIESVKENRQRVQKILGLDSLIIGRQVHGVDICVIDKQPPLGECDGLITQEKGLALTILHADCQAAIFYDPVQHLVANIHCGWRGNVQNIYQKTVELLQKKGSCPENILVCISPSLGPKNGQFIHYKQELPAYFQEFRQEGDLFDFWEISKMQLQKAGILFSHIECANLCTYENNLDFFSYRRDKNTGRHATIVSLL